MSPEESAAVAAWVAAVVAGLFGISGFVVGLVGLRHARQAKEAAASANAIAKDANSISKWANSLSEESNQIARDANKISETLAARGDEQHDVDWDWEFDPDNIDMVRIQNIGKHEAHGAVIQFFFEDVTEANPRPLDVAGREVLRFEIPTLKTAIVNERSEREENRRQHERSPMYAPLYLASKYRTRLRVNWRSELGSPKSYDSGWKQTFLPD